MGEIADLGARPLHNIALGDEQQVELGGERRDLQREFAGDLLRLAAPHRDHFAPKLPQRPQAVARLQGHGDHEQNRQQQEGDA